MDKKRSEDIKTMILICLIFIGINYGIYTFVMMPKLIEINDYKMMLEDIELNQSVQEIKEMEKVDLLAQIEESKTILPEYDAVVVESLDTIAMTVNVYDFINVHGGIGKDISFDITDIVSGVEDVKEPEESNVESGDLSMSTQDDGLNPDMSVSEEVVDENDKKIVREGIIAVNLELPKEKLKVFLDDLHRISNQYLRIDKLVITVAADENVDKTLEVIGEEAAKVDTAEVLVTEAVEAIAVPIVTEGSKEAELGLSIEIVMKAFVTDGGVIKSQRELYEFYEKYNTYKTYKELFEMNASN